MDILTRHVLVNFFRLHEAIRDLGDYIVDENRKVFRRYWTRPEISREMRDTYGAYSTLFNYYLLNNHEEFYKFTGVTVQQFVYLYSLIQEKLQKKSFRVPLPPEFRLAAVLKYITQYNTRYALF